jgi:hypothetical protein
MGLVALAEEVVVAIWRRARLLVPAVLAVVLLVTVPTTIATARFLAVQWTDNGYADLRLAADHVPDFQALLGTGGPRRTVLTYEDWSALAWYQTGAWLVAMDPPGYAKLAFDPAAFTGHSQAARRRDLASALEGDPLALAQIADRYAATDILLARRRNDWGLIDIVAGLAVDGSNRGVAIRAGNGWELVDLDADAHLALPLRASGPIYLELRFEGIGANGPRPARRFRLIGVDPAGGEHNLAEMTVPPSGSDTWQAIPVSIDLPADDRLVLDALDPLSVQSVRGFVPAELPAGWLVRTQTDDAVLLVRQP